MGGVLLLGVVAATEQYFRTVLAGAIEACPICRAKAAEAMLSLKSVDYYGADNLGHGLLEGMSLASEKELKNATQKLAGIQLDQSGSLRSALQQYDKVCHLRVVSGRP